MKDNKLFNLLKEFIYNATPLVDEAIEKRYFKPKYDKYPTLKYRENGMPEINEYGNAPIKISDLFNSYSGKPDLEIDSIVGYKNIFNYLISHDKYREFNYLEQETEEDSMNFFRIMAKVFLIDLLGRYYLLNKTEENDEKLLENIYIPIENYLYSENLNFDIATPILFTNFDFDEYKINKNVIIRRITDEFNMSRISIKSYSPPVTSSLISCATHEFVLKNYYSKKPKRFLEDFFSKESIYSHEKFEVFYNSLKIVTNINTGYAQVLVYPHDWVKSYRMDLPYLTGISVKRYPSFFENFYWNVSKLPKVSEDEIKEISILYLKIVENKNNKLKIANKRLRYSYLRVNEEDSILDIIIALETLLSDSDKGEITHKLSLRIAKLLDVFGKGYDPVVVFNSMKKIYAFRSSIVHGSSKIDSKREIKLPNSVEPIKTITLANDYLREIIRILLKNPKFLDSKEIDKLLLKNTLPNN